MLGLGTPDYAVVCYVFRLKFRICYECSLASYFADIEWQCSTSSLSLVPNYVYIHCSTFIVTIIEDWW